MYSGHYMPELHKFTESYINVDWTKPNPQQLDMEIDPV